MDRAGSLSPDAVETSPLSDRPLRLSRARTGLPRWLATLVLLLGLGGPLSSLGGGETVASSSEAHAEVLSSPVPGGAARVQRARRTAATTPLTTAPAVDRTVTERAGEPWPPTPGVATLPDPRGPPARRLG